MATPGFVTRAPIDLGPRILCAARLRVSASAATSTVRPKACTASTCTRAPARRAAAITSATGWTTPVSAFTACTATSRTPPSGERCARGPSRSSTPSGRTRTHRTRARPSRSSALGHPRHRRVLESARHERPRCVEERGAQRDVVRLGAARREDHVARVAAGQAGNRFARVLDAGARRAARGVHARGIAPGVAGGARHRVDDFGQRRRRGVPVEVHAAHE